ncbi:hypothetical protein [Psychrilyobacter atlanticus]|uniref:hypothetical protein n=1 Tax=Psychrilyobacter atlanticus TaxID=271091 RepID=UPI0004258426|nr:hypothetical protein [Psychrilyobacter atlanticus]
MKKKILLFTGVVLMGIFMYSMPYTSSLNGTSISQTGNSSELKLQYRKGLYYELGKGTPFTGKMKVNYEKEYVNSEGNYKTKEAIFENEYVNGVIKNTNYYTQNGTFEYNVKKI